MGGHPTSSGHNTQGIAADHAHGRHGVEAGCEIDVGRQARAQHILPALRLAQRDIDLRPELYTRYYKNEFPERFRSEMDTRRWGPGERIVFEPYTKDVFEQSFEWIAQHGIFPEGQMGAGKYEDAVCSIPAE